MIPEEGEEIHIRQRDRVGSKLEKLGKVHLTKKMVREREIFLGVKSKLNSRGSKACSKDFGNLIDVTGNGSVPSGNASM